MEGARERDVKTTEVAAAEAGKRKQQTDSGKSKRKLAAETDNDHSFSASEDEEEAPTAISSKKHHICIIRRTTANENGDISTQFIAVAKIGVSQDVNLTWMMDLRPRLAAQQLSHWQPRHHSRRFKTARSSASKSA